MLRSIIQSSLKSRLVIVALAAALMVFGIVQMRHISVDVLPEFSRPYVEIQTEALGLSAEEVEQMITVPMEQDLLNGVAWLDDIRSESMPGLSSVVLFFDRGTDPAKARQMVQEKMTLAFALPHVSRPPTMLQPVSATSRIMIFGLSSKTVTPIQMSVLARWTVAPRLMGVPGVANVAIWGQRDRQLQVQVDPKRLHDHKISLHSILETTGNALWVSSLSFVEASTPGTGGFIDLHNQRLGIRHVLPIVSPEGLAQVPIEASGLTLGDVANVVEDHQPLIGDALTNAGPGLLLVVQKFPGANTADVTRGVERALAELNPGMPGIDVDSKIFRPADFNEAAARNINLAVLIGFFLVVLVLAVLVEWRTLLISLLAIIVSLLAAGFVLYTTGANFNMIVLTGLVIAVGVVVYDAVVDVENVARRLRKDRSNGDTHSTARIILEASIEARSPIVYATLILLLAILPTFFMGGIGGVFFKPLAVSYALAVLASMLVALTLTPALCLILFANRDEPTEHRASPLLAWFRRVYESLLTQIVPQGRMALVAVGVLTVVGLAILPFLNRSMLPVFKERNLLIHLSTMPGTSQPEMSRITGRVGRELQAIPGVRDVGAHIGRAVFGDNAVDVNAADLWIKIDPSVNYEMTTAAIQNVIDGYPGLSHRVQTYLSATSEDVVAKPEDDVVIRVYGDVDRVLRVQAESVRKAITGVAGIVDSHVKYPVQQPVLETRVNIVAAQRHGLKPGDVRRAAATLMSGIQVGSLFEEQKVFDVVVWSTPETRHSLSSIGDLPIDTPGGGHVRLGDVATVKIVPGSSVIHHESVKRYLDVVAEVKGRNLGSVATDVKARIQELKFPLEYHAEVRGEHAVQQADRSRQLVLVLGAALGALFLLQAAFGSWRLALLPFLTLPSALVGGLLAALATDGTLSLGTYAGLLAVFGIAVCHAVMLIRQYQRMERQEVESFGPQLVLRGAREGLAPILTSTLVIGALLVPALFLGDLPGLEIVRPMAAVVLGGLVTSIMLNLFFLPALFLQLGVSSAEERDPFHVAAGAQDHGFGGLLEVPATSGD